MTFVDYAILILLTGGSLGFGLYFARRSAKGGAEGYFTGNRNLPWWSIGLSNTATYQSGSGAFVMLILAFGLPGNWLWWASWIIWMPLVALVWARLWRRMKIVTTAELITLRYGGKPAEIARKIYALVCCCGFAVLLIGYSTGFFAKVISPVIPLSELEILLIFGGIAVIYTMLGGLVGVVYTDAAQFVLLMAGSLLFLWFSIDQLGGWTEIVARVGEVRTHGLKIAPPSPNIETLTLFILVLQGIFFAGSPTAGEGMTAQRFMAARNEAHAVGGQLFNAFLALTLRTLPIIGLGIVAMSVFWTPELADQYGFVPEGMIMLEDPVHAWGELAVLTDLPLGFIGLLLAVEAAAYMSTQSSLINWGSSFIVNDFILKEGKEISKKKEIWISRAVTLGLFAVAAIVAILFVENMIGWFLFINSAMVMFLLPLSWLRFFWWRFNVWGELSAIILGLPLSIIVWFGMDYQNEPIWQGLGILFVLSFATLIIVTLLTPPESKKTLLRFYERCRPPGLWQPIRELTETRADVRSTSELILDCALGIAACLGMVLATNSVFIDRWDVFFPSLIGCIGTAGWLLYRIWDQNVELTKANKEEQKSIVEQY